MRIEFLEVGGDPEWLGGSDAENGKGCIPQKLTNLWPLSALLSHQPWRGENQYYATVMVHRNLLLTAAVCNEPPKLLAISITFGDCVDQ